jgi:hypothetical protein
MYPSAKTGSSFRSITNLHGPLNININHFLPIQPKLRRYQQSVLLFPLLARRQKRNRTRLTGPPVEVTPDTIIWRTADTRKVAVLPTSAVVFNDLRRHVRPTHLVSKQHPLTLSRNSTYPSSPFRVIVNVQPASLNTPSGFGLK